MIAVERGIRPPAVAVVLGVVGVAAGVGALDAAPLLELLDPHPPVTIAIAAIAGIAASLIRLDM